MYCLTIKYKAITKIVSTNNGLDVGRNNFTGMESSSNTHGEKFTRSVWGSGVCSLILDRFTGSYFQEVIR